MKLNPTAIFIVFILFSGFLEKYENTPAQKDRLLISFVNPFIETKGLGHTYPGTTMPFGIMQLCPGTRLAGWDGCCGYHYSKKIVVS